MLPIKEIFKLSFRGISKGFWFTCETLFYTIPKFFLELIGELLRQAVVALIPLALGGIVILILIHFFGWLFTF